MSNFDPKVLLDAVVASTAHRPQEGEGGAAVSGGLAGILEQIAGAARAKQQQQELPQAGDGGQMGGFGDILKKLAPNAQQGGSGEPSFDLGEFLRKITGGGGTVPEAGTRPAGGLGDLMGQILGKLNKGAPSKGDAGVGGLGQVLGQMLNQATAGVREGGSRFNEATGASEKLDEMIRQATGQSAPELVARIKDFIAQNQLAAGAAAGGLGTILLGTKTGRSLALDAAKLGGLALIGGLAYKAYQNQTQGKPVPGADARLRQPRHRLGPASSPRCKRPIAPSSIFAP